jgi:radical SAM/Cys-rich protein
MNAFLSVLDSYEVDNTRMRRGKLSTLQVNLGNLCNQRCKHCHIGASPQGKNIMSREVIDDILRFLSNNKDLVLDITGGAPEMNPDFDYLLCSARRLVKEIIVRSNLTIFFEPGNEYLPRFYEENNIHLICSLPCYTEEGVDFQRGNGVFKKSIKALRFLNDLGFSKKKELVLDLVYNPSGAALPPQQEVLEKDYKRILEKDYGIGFNRLITITNVPVKRFRDSLESKGEYDKYLDILRKSFNPGVVDNLMCHTFLSVGYDGKVYDCDFNLSLGLALKDDKGKFLTIDRVDSRTLEGKEIVVGEHCLACTAGFGSSCQGVLVDRQKSSLLDKKDVVRNYYGKILKSKEDLKTSVCCFVDVLSLKQRDILQTIHPEIIDKFYGCGSPIPPVLEGMTVLDLGCGTGRDVYVTSFLVGNSGFVIGVDMTDEQLAIARKHRDFQMKQFGFTNPNVEFKKGYIENLKEIGIEDNSVDVVISNCVINLSADKRRVFFEIFRILKPGGELYFSDIFAGRRLPESLKSDSLLYGECLGGALYIEDFRRILRDLGCLDYRVMSKRRVEINNAELDKGVGMIDFYSITVRVFKLDGLEDICEDYGQAAVYLGTIPGFEHKFALDDHHIFITGKPMLVCGNTASMLSETRYSRHFKVTGDRNIHYGAFDCSPAVTKIDKKDSSLGGACC